MKAIVTNKLTVIKDATPEVEQRLSKMLSYRDKSKDFQLRRLGRNPANKRSSFYKKLEKEAYGSMLHRLNDGNLAMSSGFVGRLESMGVTIEDRRKLTGKTVPLPWKKKPHDLRDYQEDAVDKMLNNNRGIINFATGLGKTLVAVHAIKKHRTKTLVTAPTESIAKQFYEVLIEAFGDAKVGFYGAGKKKIKEITVGICASVNNNIDDFVKEGLGLIIMDEAHHTPASTFFNICWALADVGKIFGLTATDYRSDGKDIMIEAACGGVLVSRDINWGVANKWLAKPKFIMKQVDTKHKRNFKDDKIKSYKEHVLHCDEMKQQILQDIQEFIARGKSVLCLVSEVEHGLQLSEELGVPLATGKDKKSQEYVNQFNKGDIKCLIGTSGKISEGTDTRPVDVLIMANFIASKGPVIQSVGRGLRKTDTKDECLILDYCPTGSEMLSRHAQNRLKFYKEITDDVEIM